MGRMYRVSPRGKDLGGGDFAKFLMVIFFVVPNLRRVWDRVGRDDHFLYRGVYNM